MGLSELIIVAWDSMKETIRLLKGELGLLSIPVIIGESLLNQKICDFIGADYWTKDAMEGVRICQRIVDGRRPAFHPCPPF